MVNVFITFYRNLPDPIHNEDRLFIFNGFSFGREYIKGEHVDIFVDSENSTPSDIAAEIERYANVEHIYCSCHFNRHFKCIESIIDERWIIGGALSAAFIATKSLPINVDKRIVGTPLEEFLGQPLSSSFSYYFAPLANKLGTKNLFYACSLGFGCYWSKCEFCDFTQYHCAVKTRPHVSSILAQLRPIEGCLSTVHTCISTLTPEILEEVCAANLCSDLILHSFVRADTATLNVFRKLRRDFNDRYRFTIGAEAFSQTLLNKFNKGTRIEDLLELIELIMINNGKVRLTVMDDFACMNDEIASEYLENLEKLDKITRTFSRQIEINNESSVIWVSEEKAKAFCDRIPIQVLRSNEEDVASVGFKHIIKPETQEYKLNKMISDRYREIDFRMLGVWKYIDPQKSRNV